MKSMMELVMEQYEADKDMPDYEEEDVMTKDMTLMDADVTVGHILANPNFDVNADVVIFNDDYDIEPILYESDGLNHQNSNPVPTEILLMNVTYITIRDGKLAIGVHV